jgi:general nucleoside transport system ATP-binding protein
MADATPTSGPPAVVSARGITKRFGAVTALEGVDLDLYAGEVHALLGENGAGKSTLNRVLFGMTPPDRGVVAVDGEPRHLASPADAIALGVGMVHQHYALVPTMTVVENMALVVRGRGLRRPALDALRRRVVATSTRFGLDVDPDARIDALGVGRRQRVEILRALWGDARVLLFDEPTAVLAPTEVDQLLVLMRNLAEHGAAVVFVSHKLPEVLAVCDRFTVLRRGRHVVTLDRAEADAASLSTAMLGERRPRERQDAAPGDPGDTVLALDDVSLLGNGQATTLRVRRGEIVAIAGVEGNGQAELERLAAGIAAEAPVGVVVPARRRVGYIPSDRARCGLIAELSVAENLVLTELGEPRLRRRGLVDRGAVKRVAADRIGAFDIRVSSERQPAGTLSGGNAQKVVLARELSKDVDLIVAAEPTRGLDVAASAFVHDQLRSQRDAGVGVLVLSTDLDELTALADRLLVMRGGGIVGEWARSGLDIAAVGAAMVGHAAGTEPEPDRRPEQVRP